MSVLHILLALVIILFILYVYITDKNNHALLSKIPGPEAYPIIGHFEIVNRTLVQWWDMMREISNKYYPITRYWVGSFNHVLIRHPHDLEVLLSNSKHIEKGFMHKLLFPWLKTGLFTSTGDKWRGRRNLLTCTLLFTRLEAFLDPCQRLARSIKRIKSRDEEFGIYVDELSTDLVSQVLFETMMGIDLEPSEAKYYTAPYTNSVITLKFVLNYRLQRPYILDWVMKYLPIMWKCQTIALGTLNQFTNKVLIERRMYHRLYDHKFLDFGIVGDNKFIGTKSLSILDLLMTFEKDGDINTEGIKEELNALMFAGTDTTAMALSFTLLLLAEHKEIQDKARSEVTEVWKKSGGLLETKHVKELLYLERCIQESMRMFPPVPVISRVITEDIKLRGYTIPKGTEVSCQIFDLHRDPKIWPEPEKYDPDRFLPECVEGRHLFSYIPFGAGPRNCIGEKFAMTQLKYMLAHILHNYEIRPIINVSRLKFKVDFVLNPITRLYVNFKRINSP